MAGGISLHAVDVASGVPAAGMRVEIFALQGATARSIAQGVLGANGALDHAVVTGTGVEAGVHEAHFHLGDWWRERGTTQAAFFQEVAVFRFNVVNVQEHYHLPLKFTAWGFALFRGA